MKIEDLIKTWSEKISKNTIRLYLHNLSKINGGLPDTTDFLMKPDEVLGKIDSIQNPKSRKTFITAVLSALRYIVGRDDPLFQKYSLYLEKLARTIRATDDERNGAKTEKEEKNWLEFSQVQKKLSELKDEVKDYKQPLSKLQKNKLTQYFILSLYTTIPPRRSLDYAVMSVVKKYEPKMSDDKNYLSLSTHQFIFNEFKTKSTFGKQVFSFKTNKDLKDAVGLYVRLMGLTPSKENPITPLFATPNSSYIGRVLNSIWAKDGKKISSSMLRHIYLSSKYNLSEQKEDAVKMGHSVEEQKNYLRE